MKAHREKKYSSTLSLTSAPDWGERLMPPLEGETQYPLYERLGGAQGQTGQVQKISLPPGFQPCTIHTSYAILGHLASMGITNMYTQNL
jgi:hypothetical protein